MFLMVKSKIICFWQSESKGKVSFFHVISRVPTINMTFTVDVNLYLSASEFLSEFLL